MSFGRLRNEHTVYNRVMLRGLSGLLSLTFLILASGTSLGQQNKTGASSGAATAQRGLSLAESGNCSQALPLLKKLIRQTADKDLKKRIGLVGVRCAMTHNFPYESMDFLQVLIRDFPRDPEVL